MLLASVSFAYQTQYTLPLGSHSVPNMYGGTDRYSFTITLELTGDVNEQGTMMQPLITFASAINVTMVRSTSGPSLVGNDVISNNAAFAVTPPSSELFFSRFYNFYKYGSYGSGMLDIHIQAPPTFHVGLR